MKTYPLKTILKLSFAIGLSGVLSMCTAVGTTVYENERGAAVNYRNVESASSVGGIGLESRDILSITDDMMRDLVSSGILTNREVAPRVIIDSRYITNESSARINTNIITDTLRTELIRNSGGRVVFVTREYAQMVEEERELKRNGVVDRGTIRLTDATAGADFRLVGRISSMDAVNTQTALQDRTYSFTFEIIDLELNVALYALGPYQFSKFGQDNVIYR